MRRGGPVEWFDNVLDDANPGDAIPNIPSKSELRQRANYQAEYGGVYYSETAQWELRHVVARSG